VMSCYSGMACYNDIAPQDGWITDRETCESVWQGVTNHAVFRSGLTYWQFLFDH
jgi:hypothetical protein